MLEKIDLKKRLSKEDGKSIIEKEEQRLSRLQRECRTAKIPVMVVFEGMEAAGKGVQIGNLIQTLDPRGFRVYSVTRPTKNEKMHPFLWRFWNMIPENGNMAIFDRSWYTPVLSERLDGDTNEAEVRDIFDDIINFEKQLSDGGYVIIKLFLHISKKEQRKRFDELLSRRETKWRVTDSDLRANKKYDEYVEIAEEMLEKTDTKDAPWSIIEATDKEYAQAKILSTVSNRLEYELNQRSTKAEEAVCPEPSADNFTEGALNTVEPFMPMSRQEYDERMAKLNKRLEMLHNEIYQLRIPVIIGFEGWDAGGKGGAIKRLTSHLDPRGYAVFPTSAPNDTEKSHHYLWRFWRNMPKAGHIAIFDRTWYGRVMVERIEKFCSVSDWQRAYKEINDMEKTLANSGAVVLKFWLQIDKDEQEKRFKERQENPEKQWKITQEDWRNRAKWDEYEKAVNEMLVKTSTISAPWIIVEGNNKLYARVKVLETVADAIEEKIAEKKKK